MTSIELTEATAAALNAEAERSGLTVDGYVHRLMLREAVRRHSEVFDEQFYADAEAERLAG